MDKSFLKLDAWHIRLQASEAAHVAGDKVSGLVQAIKQHLPRVVHEGEPAGLAGGMPARGLAVHGASG